MNNIPIVIKLCSWRYYIISNPSTSVVNTLHNVETRVDKSNKLRLIILSLIGETLTNDENDTFKAFY